ncbi:PspC domain-containing protein [Candidatus Sumerlaeota bacterium]|nr:PspC domain-containing protein [Candidatus Sumerlaeota bacterium]
MNKRHWFSSRGIYRGDKSVFLGVCSGIAEHFDFSTWGVRLAFLVVQCLFFRFTFVLYIVLGIMMKRAPRWYASRSMDY